MLIQHAVVLNQGVSSYRVGLGLLNFVPVERIHLDSEAHIDTYLPVRRPVDLSIEELREFLCIALCLCMIMCILINKSWLEVLHTGVPASTIKVLCFYMRFLK